MKELFVVRAAEADLLEIWVSLFEHSALAADRVIDEITDSFDVLCEHPLIGRSRSEFGAHYRILPVGNYVIFYRVRETKLEISRVLHGARDLMAQFSDEDEEQ